MGSIALVKISKTMVTFVRISKHAINRMRLSFKHMPYLEIAKVQLNIAMDQ
jgi:hypothetical protein